MGSPRDPAATPDYRALFERVPGLYLLLAPDLSILDASDAYLRATMTRREDIVGRGLFEVFPDNPDDPHASGVANLRASLARVLRERRSDTMAVQKYDIRRPEAEGGGFEERYWSPTNHPVTGPGGEVACIVHAVEDVTEFIRLQQRDREHAHAAEALRSRAGRMEAEIYRRAQELQRANQQLRDLHAGLELRVAERTAELQRANERLQREIVEHLETERALTRSEEQLRQSQKLEAAGRLAGGIAHDFNNLLSVILMYTELLLADLPEGGATHAMVREVQSAGRRAADLTRQLLAFSRQQVLEPVVLDLNDVIAEFGRMLGRVLGEDIELRVVHSRGPARVRADRSQLEQVILNLVVNARDAMPDGGRVTIEVDRVDLDEAYARDHVGVEPGPYVLLGISDTGSGMDRATQARAFEPFFTTKAVGKGTGLGLSTVHGIVRQSGGGVWLYSEPGQGTTFKIYLPRTESTPAPGPAAKSDPPAAGGRETILLVEDEDSVRSAVSRILREAGYRVIEAAAPADAICVAEGDLRPLDLLLSDVVMPGLNGRQLAARVRELRPGIRTILMSGYTDDVVLQHGVLDEGVAFVQKPLTPAVLRRKVREVLDAAVPHGRA